MSSTARVITRAVDVKRSPRVMQLEGMFDMAAAKRSERTWAVDLPLEERNWNIGLIVGPSGSGKSTLLRELWASQLVERHEWSPDAAVIDGFPSDMSMRDVTSLLSSVGFASPPSWLRPFEALSNGEQFRATVARAIAEADADGLVALDEFTSVVDRTVAQIGSAAVAKTMRRRGGQLVVATCHYDVADWLQPDWIYQPHLGEFSWRSVQPRPRVELEVYRSSTAAWPIFRAHHYLSAEIAAGARCYVALVDGQPAAFSSMLNFPHPKVPNAYRMHRTVTLPDFQGIGIGNHFAELVASIGKARGKRVYAAQSHPAINAHQARSPLWRMSRPPSRVPAKHGPKSTMKTWRQSFDRLTASFEYVGPPADETTVAALAW